MKSPFFIILVHLCLLVAGQHQDKVDFEHASASITIDPYSKKIEGQAIYTLKVLQKVDSVFLDAKNMEFSFVRLNGKKVKSSHTGNTISIKKKLKKGKSYEVSLSYATTPQQAVYFMGWDRGDETDNRQIWTQGQGKYTSHWLPSFDDMNEKLEFDLNIIFDTTYEVIANGKLKGVKEINGLKEWSFDMQRPMSSYLLAFAIGDYVKKEEVSTSGIPLEMYYYPADSLKVEPTYRYTQQIFDFLEKEIGVPYPWQNYKQVPVKDFLYAGMENTGTTIFSDSFVVDSIAFMDKNYVNVNAHELAHQWFGNLVTEVDGDHHWLHEGFATYYALLAEKEIFGDTYFYWKLYESAKHLDALSREGNGEKLTNGKASSLTFYEKGAWALYMLNEKIGETAFKNGIRSYLKKHQFQNVTISDFMYEMEQASGKDLSDFQELWLYNTDFPFADAKESLKNASKELRDFFDLQWELTTSSENNETIIQRYWDKTESIQTKKQIIDHYYKLLSDDFLRKAFETNAIEIRQALATAVERIPANLKKEFESLLEDKNYSTIENALYRLWIQFPEDRIQYLEKTKDVVGFPNKNVRLLWLALAVLTKGYETHAKQEYIGELGGYTSPRYAYEVRQGAFQYLYEAFALTDKNLKDLVNASVHPVWQFRKFARNLLDKLLEDDGHKKRLMVLSKELNGEELRYINNKLNIE